MWRKIYLPLALITLSCLAALLQLSFIFPLATSLTYFNLVLLLLLLVLFFFDLSWAVIIALSTGLILDFFSFYFFGLHILSLLFTLAIAERLLSSWLTNRSLYSLLLLIAGSILIYNLFRSSLVYLSALDQELALAFGLDFWQGLAWQIWWGVIAGLLFFIVAGALMRRLKPVFLDNK